MSVAYQAVSLEDREAADLKARYLREQAERQHGRVRCGFLCVFLLVPASIILALVNGKAKLDWKPEPRRDAAGWRPTHQAYVREIRNTGKVQNTRSRTVLRAAHQRNSSRFGTRQRVCLSQSVTRTSLLEGPGWGTLTRTPAVLFPGSLQGLESGFLRGLNHGGMARHQQGDPC